MLCSFRGTILACFFLFQLSAVAQYVSTDIEHISVEQGLFQSTVNCVLQDSRGFLWLGTNDGLSRYDGYSFITHRNNPSDPYSIPENSITSIAEDNKGNLWLGTSSGFIIRYNPYIRRFTSFKLNTHPLFTAGSFPADIPLCYASYTLYSVTTILCDKYGYIWAGTFGSGLYQFDTFDEKLEHYYYTKGENTISSNFILSLAADDSNNIWAGTYGGGLNRISSKLNKNYQRTNIVFSNYKKDTGAFSLTSNRISSLVYNDSLLWIGTYSGGLFNCNPGTNGDSIKFFLLVEKETSNSLSNNLITKLTIDSENNVWIGTDGGGLNKLNLKTQDIIHYKHDPLNSNTIDDNTITALAAGKGGLIWAGTLSGYGLNKIMPSIIHLIHYKNNPLQTNSISDNNITTFAEDDNDIVWIGTMNGGLNKYNKKDNSFISYKHDPLNSNTIGSNYVTSILADKNKIWVGTYNDGIHILDKNTNKIVHYRFEANNKTGLVSNKITSIAKDKNNNIWIGTSGSGVNKVVADENSNLSFAQYEFSELFAGSIPDNNISSLFTDTYKNLWLLTRNGVLCSYDYANDEFKQANIKKFKNKDLEVLPAFCNEGKYIYMASNSSGIIKYDIEQDKVIELLNPKILAGKRIYSIVSYKDALWLSTSYGIVKYEPSKGSINLFNNSNGVQSLRFNLNTALITRDSQIFFGGTNGFNCFYTDSIKEKTIKSEIILTSFKASNKDVPFENNKIELNAYDNSILIEFANSDFTDPAKNIFMYKLAGRDKDWIFMEGGEHRVLYEDLPPGDYLFTLKSLNSHGIWNRNPFELKISIAQVFWKTWWFILLSILIAASLLAYFIYIKVSHFLAVEKLKTRLSADLHDSVGSGLTEISLLSEIIQRDYIKTAGKDNPDITVLSQRARELIDNMSDIVWLVNPKPNTLYQLVIRLKEIYTPIAVSSGINIKFEVPESFQSLLMPMEKRQHVYLIFKEAINNSIKYSKAGSIVFMADAYENTFELKLRDDGCGFDVNNDRGNGLNNMRNRARAIDGEFLIKSEQGKGTTIMLTAKQ